MNRRIHVSVESIMVILLMIIFAASMSVLIYQGSVTYRNIINNKNEEENVRIALSYVNMRIKQNDISENIVVDTTGYKGQDVLIIHHYGEEEGLMSYIYYYEGYLWECYTDGDLDHTLSTEIIPLKEMTFEFNDNQKAVITSIPFKNDNETITLSQVSTLRTETAR